MKTRHALFFIPDEKRLIFITVHEEQELNMFWFSSDKKIGNSQNKRYLPLSLQHLLIFDEKQIA